MKIYRIVAEMLGSKKIRAEVETRIRAEVVAQIRACMTTGGHDPITSYYGIDYCCKCGHRMSASSVMQIPEGAAAD